MREVMVKAFKAFDGKLCESASACREYEAARLHLRLANLTPEQVQAAIDRADPELAEAFEQAGMMIRLARRKAGDLKRPPVDRPGPVRTRDDDSPGQIATSGLSA